MQLTHSLLALIVLLSASVYAQVDDNPLPRPGDDRPLPPGPQVPQVPPTQTVPGDDNPSVSDRNSTTTFTSSPTSTPTNSASSNAMLTSTGILGSIALMAAYLF